MFDFKYWIINANKKPLIIHAKIKKNLHSPSERLDNSVNLD